MTDATRRAEKLIANWIREDCVDSELVDAEILRLGDRIVAALQQVERDTYTRAAALVGHQVTGPGPLRQHLVALLRHHATEGSR